MMPEFGQYDALYIGDHPIEKAYLGDMLAYWTGQETPYLRIEPEVIWVVPDWSVDNEVFSNTTWNIN